MEQPNYMVRVNCMTYNHAPYITDALNGFCMQETTFPFVCTIIDDASTDGEQEVIKKYLQEHFDLEDKAIVRKEETDDYILTFARHSVNLNCYFAVFFLKYNHYSIKKPKGPYYKEWLDNCKYIAMCEGDDYWIVADKLQRQVEYMETHEDCSMCHTSYKLYYVDENVITISKDVIVNPSINDFCREHILYQYKILTLTVLVRKSAYIQARNKDPFLFSSHFLMGDTNLWYELSFYGRIHFIPEQMAMYRKMEGTASRFKLPKQAYRFYFSSAEMRLYLAKRDSISQEGMNILEKRYDIALMNYMAFDKTFTPQLFGYTSSPSTIEALYIKMGIMKILLCCKFYVKKHVASIYRRLFHPTYSF